MPVDILFLFFEKKSQFENLLKSYTGRHALISLISIKIYY